MKLQLLAGSLSIPEFYYHFMNLWAKYTNIIYRHLSTEGHTQQWKAVSLPVAYVLQGRPQGRDMCIVQCFCCNGHGQYASNCLKRSTITAKRIVMSLKTPNQATEENNNNLHYLCWFFSNSYLCITCIPQLQV